MNIFQRIYGMQWYVRDAATNLWLIVKHRPFIICPFCKGKGGAVSGYEAPEWSECFECYYHWESLDDHGMRWAVGRMPLWMYLRSRASIWCGLWYAARFRDLIRCKLGLHSWMDEPDHGVSVCCTCYEQKELRKAKGAGEG